MEKKNNEADSTFMKYYYKQLEELEKEMEEKHELTDIIKKESDEWKEKILGYIAKKEVILI